jgi:hypothetical protein
MSNVVKDCRDCVHCSWDPDGLWCAKSLEVDFDSRPFGRSIETARRLEYCGPTAKLFELADLELLRARGRVR